MKVLSIDFDFWVRDDPMLDFGHHESHFFLNKMWSIRASDYLARDNDLRKIIVIDPKELPAPAELQELFANKMITVSSTTRKQKSNFAISESHAAIVPFLDGCKDIELLHIDAHHDFGYRDRSVNCDNWVKHLVDEGRVKSVHLVYPNWRKEIDCDFGDETEDRVKEWTNRGIEVKITYGLDSLPARFHAGKAFLCRSGTWVPPWLDKDFRDLAFDLMDDHPSCMLYGIESLDTIEREMNWDEISNLADSMREMLKAMHRPKTKE